MSFKSIRSNVIANSQRLCGNLKIHIRTLTVAAQPQGDTCLSLNSAIITVSTDSAIAFTLPRQRGFTLLEVLLVITIIGIMVGVVTLSFGAIDQRRLAAEADRLKLALEQAADMALMQQQTTGWFYDAEQNSYSFKTSNNQQWQELDHRLFQAHSIKPPFTLVIEEPSTNKSTNTGASTELQNLSPDEDKQPVPNLVFLSSGEYTPFELYILDEERLPIGLQGDGFGNIVYGELDNP